MVSSAQGVSLVGQSLGHYRILEPIGAGAMGEVYRAHDEHLDRSVAVKVLSPGILKDAEARRRFREEARLLSRMQHPGIATVHDFDSHGEIDFLVTEYIAGSTVSERVGGKPLPEAEAMDLAMQLAEALAAAHALGLVHRDIKPANLRLTHGGRLKILDFGLALLLPTLGDASTRTSDLPGIAGTLPYMSPEQLRGEALDVRTDIYSAGAVLYELATGCRVFTETQAPALIDGILHKVPVPPARLNPALSAGFDDLIRRCLEKNPNHRYQTAVDLLAGLRRAASAERANSIAVLYFENLGDASRSDDYFRDGMTEDISTELARIRDLRVLSRSAVLPFRYKPVTPFYVGQQLGASYVLEGSIRREAQQLRVTAKLADTRSGHTLWAERFDRRLEDLFAIQDEIAHHIAEALRIVLTEPEKRGIEKVPTADIEAYDLYLRGRHFFHQFRRRGLDFAREMFTHAIARDAHFARAHAGLAWCAAFLYLYWDSTEANLAQAEAASLRALELDPDLAEAHAARGLVASQRKQYPEAEREFQTAMRLDPKLFEPYYFYARNFYVQGKLEEAVHWFEEASRVFPEDYQSPMLQASALHGLGRSEVARHAYRQGLLAA